MTLTTGIGREDVHIAAAQGCTSFEITFLGEPSEVRFTSIINGLKAAQYKPRQSRTIEGDQVALPVNLPNGQEVDDATLTAIGTILDQAFGIQAKREQAA